MSRRVGIVGHEAAKFTPVTEAIARQLIRQLLSPPDAVVVSGHCHLGGIDIWAEEEADKLGREKIIHPPREHSWERGYKPRNILIATSSDEVHSLVVEKLPAHYTGMRFALCYHCKRDDHVKSGGCWTAKEARKLGKPGPIHVIKDIPEGHPRARFHQDTAGYYLDDDE